MSERRPSTLILSTQMIKELLDRNPQIEVQMAEMAAEKIAEEIRRKITDINVPNMAEHAVKQAEAEIKQRGISPELKKMLATWAYEALNETAKVHMQRMMNEAISKYTTERHAEIKNWMGDTIIKYSDNLFSNLTDRVNEVIDREVVRVIREAALCKPSANGAGDPS